MLVASSQHRRLLDTLGRILNSGVKVRCMLRKLKSAANGRMMPIWSGIGT